MTVTDEEFAILRQAQETGQLSRAESDQVNQIMRERALLPAERALQPPESIEELTGGVVTRGAAEMAVGVPMGVAGATLTAGTPAAPAAPLVGLASGAAGAAAGGNLYDTAENFLKRTGVLGGEELSTQEVFENVAETATMDALFGGIGDVVRPVLGARRFLARIFGLNTQNARQLMTKARLSGLTMRQNGEVLENVGALDVGGKVPKGFARVIGVFPFTGTPISRSFAGKQQAISQRVNEIVDAFAPSTMLSSELGIDMEKAARGSATAFRTTAGRLYDNFREVASKASVQEIIPTEGVQSAVRALTEVSDEGRIFLKNQKELPAPVQDQMEAFARKLKDLPDLITPNQYRRLMRDFSKIMDANVDNGGIIAAGAQMKAALEQDLANIRVDLLPEDEALQIKNALDAANRFYAKGIVNFQTPTAQRFARIDENIFGPGRVSPGTMNADEVRNFAINLKSPQAIRDLRTLVGDDLMRGAASQHVNDAFQLSMKDGLLDAEAFAKNLGLEGRPGLRQQEGVAALLANSPVGVDDLRNFVDVAQSIVPPRDPSQFLMRRVTLGGLTAILAAGGVGGSLLGQIGAPTLIGLNLLARHGSRIVSDPVKLRLLTTALDKQVAQSAGRQAAARLVRVMADEGILQTEQPEPAARLQ